MTTLAALVYAETRRRWLTWLIFTLISASFAVMYVALFPSIKQQADQLTQVLQSMSGTLKAMGIQDLGFTTLDGFISVEYFTLVWPFLVIALAASWTGGTIAGEIDKGSLGLLLSFPVSRWQLYWAKYLTALIGLASFAIISILGILPTANLMSIDFQTSHYLRALAACLLFSWAFMSLGMLASAVFSDRGKVTMTVGGLAIIMYVATAAAGLQASLSWLKYLSFFSYYDIQNVLVKSQWHWDATIVFIAFSIITSLLGAWYFQHRDIAV